MSRHPRKAKKKAKAPPKTYPCRCPGKGAAEKPNFEGDVRAMPVSGMQDDGEGGAFAIHTCAGCGCSFGLGPKKKRPFNPDFDGLTADEERDMRRRAEARLHTPTTQHPEHE